jgi:hypothetical protein
MNLDAEAVKWLVQNWPSIIVGLTVASVYLRLSRFVARLTKAEEIVEIIRETHVERHPEDWKKLYRGRDEDA